MNLLLTWLSFALILAEEQQKIFEINKEFPQNPSWQSIVDNYNQSSAKETKNFQSATLGFLTPWNSHGYQVAKLFRKKFDYVSPAWFIIRGDGKEEGNYLIEGDHDINSVWLNAMKEDGESSKIVPRFRFQGLREQTLKKLRDKSTIKSEITAIVTLILERLQKYGFDGLVFEIDVPQYLTLAMKTMANFFKRKGFTFILVIPVSHNTPKKDGIMLFSKEHYDYLKDAVAYFSIMTYDYSSSAESGPNSPIPFIIQEVKRLCDSNCSQLLTGLPMYGNDFTLNQRGEPIIGETFIQLLRKYTPKIQWEEDSEEAHFLYKKDSSYHVVYYPTLLSISRRLDIASQLGTGISIWEIGQGLDYFYDLF